MNGFLDAPDIENDEENNGADIERDFQRLVRKGEKAEDRVNREYSLVARFPKIEQEISSADREDHT